MKNRQRIAIVMMLALLVPIAGCKKEEPATDTAVTTITAVDTTPTSATVATATVVLTDADKQFIIDAAAGLLGATAYAKTADLMGVDVAVKAYAHLLANDLGQLNDEIRALAPKHGMTLSTEIEVNANAENEKLKKATGKAFDEMFLKGAIVDLAALITLFDAESKVVSDPDLKAWVEKARPTLQADMDKAKEVQKKVATLK
jgi:putative membrane protein